MLAPINVKVPLPNFVRLTAFPVIGVAKVTLLLRVSITTGWAMLLICDEMSVVLPGLYCSTPPTKLIGPLPSA